MTRRPLRHGLGLPAAALALAGVLFLAVFPTRAYLDQRHQRKALAEQAEALDEANRRLRERAAQLATDEEIERLARLHHHLVRPGEEAFIILPDGSELPAPAVPARAGGDRAEPDQDRRGWLGRAWDWVTSRF